jgi:hypothetical protein
LQSISIPATFKVGAINHRAHHCPQSLTRSYAGRPEL